MTKREFDLGKAGVTIPARRYGRPGEGQPSLNGRVVKQGARLAFGDAIDVAGGKLRFGRRAAY
ncbi:MAG TPA: hypothetical protein VFZ74_03985 [Burkholderiales bacterium]